MADEICLRVIGGDDANVFNFNAFGNQFLRNLHVMNKLCMRKLPRTKC